MKPLKIGRRTVFQKKFIDWNKGQTQFIFEKGKFYIENTSGYSKYWVI
jgi:hypothetical protein